MLVAGMHYAGARYYMSALGRWNGPDPLADAVGACRQLLKDGNLVHPFSMSPYTYSFNSAASSWTSSRKWPDASYGTSSTFYFASSACWEGPSTLQWAVAGGYEAAG